MAARVIHPLSVVVDEKSRVLILGSFPSVISRKKNFYYANPNNRFWKIMEILFKEKIDDYEAFCHRHHIALWDVIKSCEIKGSSDNSITNVEVNDINSLINKYNISVIITNGKKSEELYNKYIHNNCLMINLPSTSSANVRYHLDDLVDKYKIILEFV